MGESTTPAELFRAQWNRQFGRYDFQRFSDLPINDTSMGHKLIDKVRVDCSFLFHESKFGVLRIGGRTWPAGIIRMDINFNQPRGCKITWATVQVSLDGEHQALQPYRDNSINDPRHLVSITHLGPSELVGDPLTIAETRAVHVAPTVSFPGGEVSGLGLDGERSYEHITRWKFSGHRKTRDDKGDMQLIYNTLQWQLVENDLEKQSSHGNTFRTAFAFANNGQPFLMRVEIQGRIHGVGHRFKSKVKGAFKFGSRAHQEQTISTTLVRGFKGQLQALNELAERLDEDMMKKNQGVRYPGSLNASTADLLSPTLDPGFKVGTSPAPAASDDNIKLPNSTDATAQLRNAALSLISPQPTSQKEPADGAKINNVDSSPMVKKDPDPEVKIKPEDDEQQNKQLGQQDSQVLNQEQRQRQMNRSVLEVLMQVFESWIWAIVQVFSRTSDKNVS